MLWRRFSVIAGGPAVIGLLLLFGREYDLFQTTGWYDVVMHLLGGGFLTVTLAGTAWHCGLRSFPRLFKLLLFTVVLLVAVVWEVFEVSAGLVPNWTHSVGDTFADIFCALAGSWVMLCLIRMD